MDPRIEYRQTEASEALTQLIRRKAEELEHFFPRVGPCDVTFEQTNHHHRHGDGRFRIRVGIGVPGDRLVVTRDSKASRENLDAFLAVDAAFHAMRRQLQDFVRRRWTQHRREIGGP